jgi:hypothetical protein
VLWIEFAFKIFHISGEYGVWVKARRKIKTKSIETLFYGVLIGYIYWDSKYDNTRE